MDNDTSDHSGSDRPYFTALAAAYARGVRPTLALPDELGQRPFPTLSPAEMERILETAQRAGLRLDRFKRTGGLPRVSRVLGALRGIQPANLLDIGSGRGAFLWPLLAEMPALSVTAVDLLPHRLQVIAAVQRGGLDNLTCARMDATRLAFPDASFDVVTLLETLEHIPDAASAVAEVARVARRFVLLSVPSQADDNPEHLHLFSQESLRALFAAAGVGRLKFSYVPKHLLVVATKEP